MVRSGRARVIVVAVVVIVVVASLNSCGGRRFPPARAPESSESIGSHLHRAALLLLKQQKLSCDEVEVGRRRRARADARQREAGWEFGDRRGEARTRNATIVVVFRLRHGARARGGGGLGGRRRSSSNDEREST